MSNNKLLWHSKQVQTEQIISHLYCIWLSIGRQPSGASLEKRFELIKKGFVPQTFALPLCVCCVCVCAPWSCVLRCIWDLRDTSNQNTQTARHLILWIHNDEVRYEALLLSDTDNLVIKIVLPMIWPYGVKENSDKAEKWEKKWKKTQSVNVTYCMSFVNNQYSYKSFQHHGFIWRRVTLTLICVQWVIGY